MKQNGNRETWLRVAEVQLVYHSKVKASERPIIQTSEDAASIFRMLWEEGQLELVESFRVLLLNRANKVLGSYQVSTGGITGTVADPRLIYIAALRAHAVGIILCHNHPSGLLAPSKADEDLTQKIKGAGSLLDIKVLDHLILTAESYFSFADEGLL